MGWELEGVTASERAVLVAVAEYFGLRSWRALVGAGRSRAEVHHRRAAVLALRMSHGLSFPEIARVLGLRSHGSALRHLRAAQDDGRVLKEVLHALSAVT